MQPAVKRQTRTETSFAPGAAPLIWPPKRLLPAVMPEVCEPCAPDTMPTFTNQKPLPVSGERLDDERNGLLDRGGRIVVAEVAHVVIDLVVGHRRLVGEAEVVVGVGPDLVVGSPPEHQEEVSAPPVAVEVRAGAAVAARNAILARRSEQVLSHTREPVRAVFGDARVVVGDSAEDDAEIPADDIDRGREAPPRRVAVSQGIRVRDPVRDLPRTRARGVEARVVEIRAGVEDADSDATAIPGWVLVHELRRAGVTRGHIWIDPRSVRIGRNLRARRLLALGNRIGQRQRCVEVDRLDAADPRSLVGLSDRTRARM